MVVGRGASDPDANSNVAKVMRLLWEGFGFGWGETCYSGVTFPLVEPGLEHAARLGYRRIVVFPYFLFTGVLVKRIYHYTDLVAARHPEIEFVKAPYLSDHPAVLDCFAERVREIIEGSRYAASRDRFKIYIIDEVHMLTTSAFNALLKTLEEPPPSVKFISPAR